jgi:2'-5' RNA ligase
VATTNQKVIKMETIRAFIAVPLPRSLLDQLATLQTQLGDQVPARSVRWVRTESIHLTLKFLGDTLTEKLPNIKQALAAVARHAPTATFTVEGVGCFPNPRRPRIVWAGIKDPTGCLEVLQDTVGEAMTHFGYEREKRNFKPHLTIGRVNRRTSRDDAAQVGAAVASSTVGLLDEVSVDRFDLIHSVLKPTGAEYTTLEEFPLRGGNN